MSIEVTRSEMQGDNPRYCTVKAMQGATGVRFVCSEEQDTTWTLLTNIGKAGKLGILRRGLDLAECEIWARWIAEQVLVEERDLREVLRDVRDSARRQA